MADKTPRRWIRGAMAAVVAMGFALGALGAVSPAEMRTWTDSSGQFQIEARLLRVEGGRVYLERKNGARMQIELKKLSPADQRYVAEHPPAGEDPFQPANDSPVTAGTGIGRGMPTKDPSGVTRVDWSSAKVLPSLPKGPWEFPVANPAPKPPSDLQAIPLPRKRQFFEKTTRLVLNPTCRRAVIGYLWEEAEPEVASRLVLCNLQDGRSVERFGPGKLIPVALSNSGNQVLMRTDESRFGGSGRLELWRLTSDGIQRTLQWTPHGNEDASKRNITWAAFVGEGRLLTLSVGGTLALWQLEPLAPLGLLRVDGHCFPTVSPDGQYVACLAGEKVVVLDAKSAAVLAAQPSPLPKATDPLFAFSPSGARLACTVGTEVFVWDFQTGELCQTLEEMEPAGDHFLWTDEGHLLLGNHLLIGADCNLKLWHYHDIEDAAFCDGICWVLTKSRDSEALLPMQIPHAGLKNAIDEAVNDPGFFLLQPGVLVRLEVNAIPDAAERENARTALTEKLQANGFQVGPDGEIALVASVERENKDAVAVESSFGGETRVYKFQHYRSCLKFVAQGRTVWETSRSNAPQIVRREPTETVEQYLRRQEKPDYRIFQTVELPKLLTKGNASGALGSSSVNAKPGEN